LSQDSSHAAMRPSQFWSHCMTPSPHIGTSSVHEQSALHVQALVGRQRSKDQGQSSSRVHTEPSGQCFPSSQTSHVSMTPSPHVSEGHVPHSGSRIDVNMFHNAGILFVHVK
jgi:hypothetical protein